MMSQSFRILILPPLLTFAILAPALVSLISHLTQRSLQTTYIIKNLQRSKPCAVCHDGFARTSFRVASLP